MNSGEYLHSRDADYAASMTAQDVEGVEVPMNVDLPAGVAPWTVPADPWAQDDEGPMATESDAHREWHRNTGTPMGTPGCPQDACHPVEDPEPGPGEGVRCAHCKATGPGRHWTVADVKECATGEADRLTRERLAHEATESRARDERRKADSDWSWEYQRRWGRAENE